MDIVSEKLLMRDLIENDRQEVMEIFLQDDMSRFLPYYAWRDVDEQSFEARSRIISNRQEMDDNKLLELAVIHDKLIIGVISAWYREMKDTVEIGFAFLKHCYSDSLATEALRTICLYLLEKKNVHRIYADIDCMNTDAIKLLESIDMRKEGMFKQDFFHKGEWRDSYVYAMLLEDIQK